MRTRHLRLPALALLAIVAACSGGATTGATGANNGTLDTSAMGGSGVPVPVTPGAALPKPLDDLIASAADLQWFTKGTDTFEIWICNVPLDSTASIYGGMQLRQPLTPQGVADVFTRQVTPYFDTLSLGQYHPVFVPGGEVKMSATDQPQDCLDQAIAKAGPHTNAVFAVATAEHGATQPGGFGSAGDACNSPPSAVGVTKRSAYIGASDFHQDWGDLKPMDLAEHEVGHTLGWMHSAVEVSGQYLSGIDVMSNSAAPRDVDPNRRTAPDTIGLNRVLAGWMSVASVWSAPKAGGTVTLAPSMSASDTRLAVVSVDSTHFLTIELLTADGFDAHLPADGVAVHRVVIKDGIVQDAKPLVGIAPYEKLLQVGKALTTDGVTITVDARTGKGPAARWTVSIAA